MASKKSKKKKVSLKNNPYVKMAAAGLLCVAFIIAVSFYICNKMMGDSFYYILYKRYDKSAAYEDTAHDLILHSRTHKPFTGVIVLNGEKMHSDTDQTQEHEKDIDELKTKKEIFIKNGQIRGEKVYDAETDRLCMEAFFEADGQFKYRRSYGDNCSYLETEEIYKKDKNVVLFYNTKGQKTIKAYIENDRFTYGFCYKSFGQTIPLTEEQLERLNRWDTTVTCRE